MPDTRPAVSLSDISTAVACLIQGEVMPIADACVVLADAAAPLDERSAEQRDEAGATSGLLVVPHEVDEVVLLSQTCDLQETTEVEYLCLLAPVRTVDATFAREALRGLRPGFAALPWLGDDRVADLNRITTVERALIAGRSSLGRPRTAQERLDFGTSVQRFLTRAALPDHVVRVLVPFVKRLKDRHDKNSAEGACLAQVQEVRVEADPDMDDGCPSLTVLMLLDESDLPALQKDDEVDDGRVDALVSGGIAQAAAAVAAASTSAERRAAWTALAELWLQPAVAAAAATAEVDGISIEVLNEEELTYARSRRSHILDLRYLSTRAA